MSNPTESRVPAIDPRLGLKFVAASHLIPLFESGPVDADLAWLMAHSAIDAYNPQSRVDCVNAARVIAFSMAALALLSRISTASMPLPEQLRAFGRANALSASADRSERAMMSRRRALEAQPPADPPAKQPEPLPHDPQAEETEIKATVAEAMNDSQAAAKPPATAVLGRAGNLTQPAMANLGAAIRANIPKIDVAPPRTASHKQDLLRNSAMHRVGAQIQVLHPA